MDKDDRAELIGRYKERLEKFGYDIRSLASGTEERRQTRFGMLNNVGDLQGASVLDLGCGFGDFYAYLRDRGIQVDYTGYDISPDLIQMARERFPEGPKFEVRDIQDSGLGRRFDYVVCSQTFNYKLKRQNNIELVQNVLRLCLDSTDKGMVFDFITAYVDFREEHLFYYQPEELFTFAKSLTKRVTLRHDYPLFEFALYLYPNFQGWHGKK